MLSQSRQHNYVYRHNIRPCPFLCSLRYFHSLCCEHWFPLICDFSFRHKSTRFVFFFLFFIHFNISAFFSLLLFSCSICSFVCHVDLPALSSDCVFFYIQHSISECVMVYSVHCTLSCAEHWACLIQCKRHLKRNLNTKVPFSVCQKIEIPLQASTANATQHKTIRIESHFHRMECN